MPTIPDIPPGWEYYRIPDGLNCKLAEELGARFNGPREDLHVWMSPKDYAACTPWPLWAVAVRKLASEADRGVGDTIHRLLGSGGEAFKATMKALGVPCGCDRRRDDWNSQYPYNQ